MFRIRWLTLWLILLLCLPALAAAEIPMLDFTPEYLQSNQKTAVYSAPSSSAWRGAKGKASVSTNDVIWCAGTDGKWMLVMYETSGGKMRVGYVDTKQLKGKLPRQEALELADITVKTTKKCAVTDDPARESSTIVTLKKGAKVTFLALYEDYAYIETKVSKKNARGFVNADYLELDAVESRYGAASDLPYDDEEPIETEFVTIQDEADTEDEDWRETEQENDELNEATQKDEYQHKEEAEEIKEIDETEETKDTNEQQETRNTVQEDQHSDTRNEDAQNENSSHESEEDENHEKQTVLPVREGEYTEDGVDYTVTLIPAVEVPPEQGPSGGPSGEGNSVVTDTGADWYGLAIRIQDDMVDYSIYKTDDRGYLLNLNTGYYAKYFLNSYNFGASRSARVYELPNGDLLAELYEGKSADSKGNTVIDEYWSLLRPHQTGFTLLKSVWFSNGSRRGELTDYIAGVRIRFDASRAVREPLSNAGIDWLNRMLERYFADWNLKFGRDGGLYQAGTRKKSARTTISSAVNSNGLTKVMSIDDANKLPLMKDLQQEAQAHFIEPEREQGDVLQSILTEMNAAGVPLRQTYVSEGSGEIRTRYITPDKLNITFTQDEQTKKITKVYLDDTSLYTFRLCKSVKDLGKLETTYAMRRGWHALVTCPSLGLTDGETLAAFDLQWKETETTVGHFQVYASVQAGNAVAMLSRTYQRAGAESISSGLTLTIE